MAKEELQKQLHAIAGLLKGGLRTIPLDKRFKGVAYVEDEGMFILRDYAYGVRDLDMETLHKRYPGKVVYFLGAAEEVE